jgi:hypothetical protein
MSRKPRYVFSEHTTAELETLATQLEARPDLRHKLVAVRNEISHRNISAAECEARLSARDGAVSEV